MLWIKNIAEWLIHFDTHLLFVVQHFGFWSYLILFLVIFAETGFVVTPFLPGDSLLFMIGAIAAMGSLNVFTLFVTLSLAAIFGDSLNYAIGKYFGLKLFTHENARFLKKEHLEHTHKFYEKYGAKTIVLARFIPIIRTFAPFVAGMGSMEYKKFLLYNIIGGIVWVAAFVFTGFWFGNVPCIKNNFEFVVLGIIVVSLLPVVIKLIKMRAKKELKPKTVTVTKIEQETTE
jgi:membrane-associated protein